MRFIFFFFNDTATTEIYTLPLHDALPICFVEKDAAKQDAAKRLSQVVLAATDISELRRAEHHMKDVAQDMRTLLDNIQDAVFVHDVTGKILDVNENVLTLHGITREEAMRGLVDFGRIEEMCARIEDRIDLIEHNRVTPLSAPLFLEVGRVPIKGLAEEGLLAEEAERLMNTAGLVPEPAKREWRVPF